MILNDSLVLDVTANPDFSQVEIMTSRKLPSTSATRCYFPEKRPFFIENADYFRTPIDLFFTRRIVNPTGGHPADRGKRVPIRWDFFERRSRARTDGCPTDNSDHLSKRETTSTIARVSRDIFKQSSIGVIYTDWEYPATSNVNPALAAVTSTGSAASDSRMKLSPNLTATLQG